MYAPTFLTLNEDEISVEEGMSTMVDVVCDESVTRNPVSVTEDVTDQQVDALTIQSQQQAADESVCVMINALISAMQTPVKIQKKISKKSTGTQAGFSCFSCDLSFLTTAGLFKHDRVKHAIFPFRCIHCNVGYITIHGLTKHLASRHKIVVKSSIKK